MNGQGWKVVDLEGFEPSTSSMPLRRAPNCATGPRRQGTPPMIARAYAVLSLRAGARRSLRGGGMLPSVNPVERSER